ncbi:MAG: methyltransferase [Acidobacteriota bacterium]
MTHELRFWILLLIWGVVLRQLFVAGRTFKRVNSGLGGSVLAIAFASMLFQIPRTELFTTLVVPGGLLLIASLALFEWAAWTIRGLFFSYIFSNDEPQFICTSGPFAYIRHPFYASYFLTQVGVAIMFPSRITALVALSLLAYFWWAAHFEEQKFERSSRSAEHAEYKRRTGRFLPKLAR